MADYEFDDIEDAIRRPEIEGKTGTVVQFPRNRWMRLLAATDANPKWAAQSEEINIELRKLENAKAPAQHVRHYLAGKFAECCVAEWGGWKSKGIDIPLSVEACSALLRSAFDYYNIVYTTVWDTKNFRGQRIQAVIDEGKG